MRVHAAAVLLVVWNLAFFDLFGLEHVGLERKFVFGEGPRVDYGAARVLRHERVELVSTHNQV